MTPVLLVLAVLVAVGGAVAMSARDPRFAALGTLVALAGSAYVADPLPGTLALGARLAGAILAGYLLWIAVRTGSALPPRAIHVPGALAVVAVALAAGWLAATALATALAVALGTGAVDGPTTSAVATSLVGGSVVARAALGAAFALVVVATGPVLFPHDVLRLGLGLLLLVAAAGLVAAALGATGDPEIQLALGILTALAGAAVASLVAASLRTAGDLALRGGTDRETAVRHRPADEAHRRPAS